MKKFLCAFIAVIACLAMLVGCSKTWNSGITDYSGTVSSNGGFLVEKGDYVYFINGSAATSDENTFGSVVEGAIVRVKKADISKSTAKFEIVVPEIVYSSSMKNDNGLFIFGDYVYYATPCALKNKEGEVRNTELEYMKTKLDGTGSEVIATIASNTDPYRFVEISGTVYLVVYTTNSDSKNVLQVYNATTKSLSAESKAITDYVLPDDLTSNYAFYSTAVHNDVLDSDESFNALHRFALDGSEDVEILNGAGTYSDAVNGIGIAGVTFSPVRFTGSQLYISETTVQTSTTTTYKGIELSDITTTEGTKPATALNYDKLIKLDNGTSFSSTIFNTTSLFIDFDSIIYFDSTYGIMKYDYNNASNKETLGREKVFYNSDLLGYTFKFVKNNLAYFTDGTGIYYSFNINDFVDLSSGEIKKGTANIKKLNVNAFNTSWYDAEIVGDYILASVSTEPYYNYVYAVDTTATDGKTDAEIEDFEADAKIVDREHILSNMSKICGILSDSDKTAYETYLEENYPETTSSES